MKKLLTIISLLILVIACTQKPKQCFLKANFGDGISGNITIYPYKEYSSWDDIKKHCIKSEFNNGILDLCIDSTAIMRTGSATINNKRYNLIFFAEPGQINFSIINDKLVAKGTPMNDEYNAIAKRLNIDEYSELRYKHNLSKEEIAIKDTFIHNLWLEVSKNPKSFVISAIFNSSFYGANLSTLDKIINAFSPEVYNTHYLASFIKARELSKASAVGMKAPDFSLNTRDGKIISLSDYKGKYLLIDFWASWCGPCRKMIPEVKKIYKAFHSKGLEVLNVSLDAKEKDWLKAIDKEQMPWAQVRDTKNVSKIFNITGIPDMFLIDKEGKILAKGIHGKAIWDELSKIGFVK